METILLVPHHRNHDGKRNHGSTRLWSSPPPSGGFRGINCRTFQYGEGLLPAPSKSRSTKTPATKNSFSPTKNSLSPKTPSSSPNENPKTSRRIAESSSVPIPMNIKFDNNEGGRHFSELWAGPAYSNSPPPSSLPMPNFSLKPKRSASLDLPTVSSEIELPTFSKSAPASPRVCSPDPSDMFDIADSATKTLRRILNLDISDE